jgi:hypothetical protein
MARRPGWIGRRVQVQWDGVRVRLVESTTGKLLREHLRQERRRVVPQNCSILLWAFA